MKSILSFIFAMITIHAFSQESREITEKKRSVKQLAIKKIIISRTLPTSAQSGFISLNSFTKLEANNDGVKATAAIAYELSTWLFNLNIEQPVSQKGKVQPITLDGLANKTSVSFSFQKIFWDQEDVSLHPENSYAERELPATKNVEFTGLELTKAYKQFLQLSRFDFGNFKIYAGGKIGLEQQAFSFLEDTVNLIQRELNKTSSKISLTLGILLRKGALAGTIILQNGYESGEPSKYYFPVNRSSVQVEKELSLGTPGHKTDRKLRIEYMSIGNSGTGNTLRINPNLNISFKRKITSLEFPVFFLSNNEDKKPKLNGGIFASYSSSKDFKFEFAKSNWGLGIFIGGSITDLF